MALQPVSPDGERRDNKTRPRLDCCPVCGGDMHVIYIRNNQRVCACEECRATLTVPATAWHRIRRRPELRAVPPPERNL